MRVHTYVHTYLLTYIITYIITYTLVYLSVGAAPCAPSARARRRLHPALTGWGVGRGTWGAEGSGRGTGGRGAWQWQGSGRNVEVEREESMMMDDGVVDIWNIGT